MRRKLTFRNSWSEDMDLSKRRFVKNVRSAKYLFSKEFELSSTKNSFTFRLKKNCCRSNEHFLLENFQTKNMACNKFFTSEREQKNLFFYLVVKRFCHFYDWSFCWKIGKFVFFTRWCVLRDFTFYSRKNL